MVERSYLSSPLLTPLQAAWLTELGLESRFVARYLPVPAKVAQATAAPNAAEPQTEPAPATATARSGMFQAGELAASLLNKGARTQPMAEKQPLPTSPASPAVAPGASLPSSSTLEGLRKQIEACTACGLHGERHLPVVGAGADQDIELMVIGEAPGAEDDRVGEPFRGKAGELLQAMLRAVGLKDPSRVYLTHLLKCRPFSNRAPSPEEVAACMVHLRRQIVLTRPKQLLVLGRVAAQALLGDVPVESLRGRLHTYQQDGMSMPLVITYHPAALLSRPRHKAAAWQDLSLLQLSNSES
ncbi:uracil-DNA glycosylase [Pusillimonas sp. CC-YST705]|uniref:Type-4 uracil-DNA glycosylase n=1 Tax=Mesopusillimonas faecipullorum TaxID=2755040 RepID=A0ABS8C852_9BURK|nr:uracil-DNA glycosylase [Mesopusillimonas faecipullorum]MCB5362211.1 uracil-DNA glycosylase [Mesopusillimonas faecipullorum]